jgi:predicted dehydrogenase
MLTIGILGSGAMGTRHARSYAALPGVTVKKVSSRSPEKAAALANEYGIFPCTDPFEILDDPDIDAVSNTLPTHLHESFTVAALQRGKHVLLEKPMALTLKACDAMIQAAEDSGRILMVAHVLRFWPEYIAIAELVHSRTLGKPLAASAQRLSARPRWGEWQTHPELTGGAVLDLHIHDVDACNWLFGEPRSIYARGQQSLDGGWDHSFTTIDYGTVAASIEGGWMLPDGHPFTYGMGVICERGSITFDPNREDLSRLLVYEPGKSPYPLPFTPGDPYRNQAAYFVDCIQAGRLPQMGSVQQARLAVAACLAARQSLETGKVIPIV